MDFHLPQSSVDISVELSDWAWRYREQQKRTPGSSIQEVISVEFQDDQDLPSALQMIYPDGVRLRFGRGMSLSVVKALSGPRCLLTPSTRDWLRQVWWPG